MFAYKCFEAFLINAVSLFIKKIEIHLYLKHKMIKIPLIMQYKCKSKNLMTT